MEAMDMVQARPPQSVKSQANAILSTLGLNMSTYINMSLKQLIIHEGIPFSVMVKPSAYAAEEQIEEINATLSMEGMPLTAQDLDLLRKIKSGAMTTDAARAAILSEVQNGR